MTAFSRHLEPKEDQIFLFFADHEPRPCRHAELDPKKLLETNSHY